MKRSVGILVAAILVSSAYAQDSLSDRTIAGSIAIAKNIWSKVQKEGRPLATKMLKSAPEYYRGAQSQLQNFIKRVDTAEMPKTFSEKQRMALEFWKLRGAINVMALTDPLVLKSVLNYRPEAIEKMQKDLQQTETKLKKANLPGI